MQILRWTCYVLCGFALLSLVEGQMSRPKQTLIGETTTVAIQGLSGFFFEMQFKKVRFEVLSSVNVSAILFSNTKIDPYFNGTLYQKCLNSTKSHFCSYHPFGNGSASGIKHEIGTCEDIVYLFGQSRNGTNGTLTFSTEFLEGICARPKEFADFEECGSLPDTVCRDQCYPRCQWIGCMLNTTNAKTRLQFINESFGMCLPRYLKPEEYQARCSSIVPGDVWVYPRSNCTYYEMISNYAGPSALLLVIFIFSLLFLILASLYYRWKLRRNHYPPFRAPDFCPTFLFPREVDGYQLAA